MACVGETGRSLVANASSYATCYELIDSQNRNGICKKKKNKAKKENLLLSDYPALGWEQSKAMVKAWVIHITGKGARFCRNEARWAQRYVSAAASSWAGIAFPGRELRGNWGFRTWPHPYSPFILIVSLFFSEPHLYDLRGVCERYAGHEAVLRPVPGTENQPKCWLSSLSLSWLFCQQPLFL